MLVCLFNVSALYKSSNIGAVLFHCANGVFQPVDSTRLMLKKPRRKYSGLMSGCRICVYVGDKRGSCFALQLDTYRLLIVPTLSFWSSFFVLLLIIFSVVMVYISIEALVYKCFCARTLTAVAL